MYTVLIIVNIAFIGYFVSLGRIDLAEFHLIWVIALCELEGRE